MLQVTTLTGVPFNVRMVFPGDAYGLNDCLTYDPSDKPWSKPGDPLVEFYDARQDPARFGPRGQFVSRYYLSTLLEGDPARGLNLQGGVPSWSLDGQALTRAVEWAKARVAERAA
jgi:hypothetical protein